METANQNKNSLVKCTGSEAKNYTGSKASNYTESQANNYIGPQATNPEATIDENKESLPNYANQDTISEVDDSHTKSDPEESIYEDECTGFQASNYSHFKVI